MTIEKNTSHLHEHYLDILNASENRMLLWEVGSEIGRWRQWVVYTLSRPDQVLKLFFDNPGNLRKARGEAARQEDFSDVLLYWQSIWLLPDVRIPELLHKICDEAGNIIGLVVKKIQWKSLHCLKTEEILQQKYHIWKDQLDNMWEPEILKKYMDDQPGFIYLDDMEWQFPKNIIDKLKEIDDFFQKNGLNHNDIHSWNVIIWTDGNLYLIDFWDAAINMILNTKYHNAINMWREARRKKYLRLENAPQHTWNNEEDTLSFHTKTPEFSNEEDISIEWVKLKVSHSSLPRHIIDKSAVIASLRARSLDPWFDNYFYPNLIGYDLGGWYFLLGEEIRVSNGKNLYSQRVLERILKCPIHGKIVTSEWKESRIYAINFPISAILKLQVQSQAKATLQLPPDQGIL